MDKETELQKGWSTFFMIGIAIMVPVYYMVGAEKNESRFVIALSFFPALTLLYIGFLLTYTGTAHKQSRVGFILSLIATLIVLFLYYYFANIGKAYTH
jgi:hypothetical protein